MGHTMGKEEKNILFQGVGVNGKLGVFQGMGVNGKLRSSPFIIRPTSERDLAIFEIVRDIRLSVESRCIESDLLEEMTSTFVGSSLYIIGGRVPNDFELSDSIRWLDIQDSSKPWEVGKLPFSCADPVIGVYKYYLCILPGVWKHGYYDEDEDTYLTKRKGCIWDTRAKKELKTEIDPPEVEDEKRQWRRIRACAALDEDDEDKGGLLVAMDGEKKNFFLYKPEKNEWKICDFEDPLPIFIGETSFAASNGRLYILEVRGKSPAFLYIYDIKAGKLVMDKMPIPKFDDLWSMDEWDRVVRLVPVADDKLCFLWLGPISYENEKMWPPYRILHYLKVKFSINPNPNPSNSEVEVEVANSFRTNITNLLDCLPCDPEQFRDEVKDRDPLYSQLIQLVDPLPPPESEADYKRIQRKVEQPKAFELESKRLCDEIAFLKAQVDELRKRLAEEGKEKEKEQHALREKEGKDYMDKGGFNMTEPGQSSETKNPSFSSGDDDEIDESDDELDNTDVAEPDNDPPQKMGDPDPSIEVTEEKQDPAQSEISKAVDAISEGKLDAAIGYLNEAIRLNPFSAISYETRADVLVKLNNPNAAISDANAAFQINPCSAKGYKIRGIAKAMLGCWEAAADDLVIASSLDDDEEIRSVLKQVELNVQKIEEHPMKYERVVKLIKIKFFIYDMRRPKFEQRRQKSEQDREALSTFKDGQVIGIHSTRELETKLNAATKTSRLSILFFTAEWCGPSRIITPPYTSLAAKYPEVVFLKVDTDEVEHLGEDFDITAVPTFLFIRNGKLVDEVVGADKGALETKTDQYAALQSFLDKM